MPTIDPTSSAWGPARYLRRIWAAAHLGAQMTPDLHGHAYELGDHGPTREDMPVLERARLQARAMGRAAGRAQGSWAADGNTSAEHISRVLTMLEEGDPQAWDHLPRTPDLSGEMADDPTPQSLAADILGDPDDLPADMLEEDSVRAEVVEALEDAWEEGVAQTFEEECERTLRAFAPDPEPEQDTSEDRCTDHGYDECPDCGNAGVKIDASGYVPCTRFLTCWSDPDAGSDDDQAQGQE